MKRIALIAMLACAALWLVACGEEPGSGPTAADYKAERERLLAKMKNNKATPPAQQPQQAAPGQAPGQAPHGGFGAVEETYSYDVRGRRDPFMPYRHDKGLKADVSGPLMAYELEQLQVVAVVWDTGNPRALVADPRGDTHVVREGTPIGKNDGLVIHIGDNLVLVKETYVDFAGEVTTNDVELRVRSTQGG